MPILEDLYNLLRKQEEPEAQRLATSLEIYVTGSLNVFNHQTNVDINNRIVCFDIKELGKQLKKIGMLVIQDQVWNRVTMNRSAHKSTRYYVDELQRKGLFIGNQHMFDRLFYHTLKDTVKNQMWQEIELLSLLVMYRE